MHWHNGAGRIIHNQRFRSSDDSSSDDGNFLPALLENERKPILHDGRLTGEIGTEAREPTTMKEASSAPNANEWRQAMEEDLHGLREKGSFKDEEPPSNMKSIKAHFVHKLKQGPDGEIERYKARLVARDSTRRPGVDFFETFSPVNAISNGGWNSSEYDECM